MNGMLSLQSLILSILMHERNRNRKFDFYSVRSSFIPIMKTRSENFTDGLKIPLFALSQ